LIFLSILVKYLIMTRSTLAIAGGKSQQFTILKIDTIFDFYKPKPPLSKFVDNFWLCEGYEAEHKSERILPTGTLELVINLGQNKLLFYDAERPENCSRFSGAVVSGAHGRGFAPDTSEEAFIIGVHFKPGGAFPFLGVPAGDLADTHIDLETLWGPSAGRLRERLCEATTSAERFQLFQEALLSRLCHGVEQHYAVSAALEMFGKNQAGPTVREAAKYLGLSQRRFIQVFKAEVGMTPKLFSRIQRFQQTRTFIQQNPSPNWAALALDLG
jgi:AraC-like DNA-binding protein